MKLPVFKTIGGTLAFFRSHFADCVRVTWLPIAITSAGSYWMTQKTQALEVQQRGLDEKTDAAEILQLNLQALGWCALICGVMFVLFPVAYAALLRWIVRGEKPQGLFYFRFGGDELRLIVAWFAAFGILLSMTALVTALAGGLAYFTGYATAMSPNRYQALVFGVVALLVVALLVLSIWVMLRLSLISAASIAEKSIGIVGAWSNSRGNSFRLLALWLLIGVLPFVVYYIAYLVLAPDYLMATLPDLGGGRDPAAELELFHAMEREAAAMIPWLTLLTFAFNLVYVPLTAIAGGLAYNALGGRTGVAGEFEEQA